MTIDGLSTDNPESKLKMKEIVFSDYVTNEDQTDYFWQYYDNPTDYDNRPQQSSYKDENALISEERANAKIDEWKTDCLSIPYMPFSNLSDEFPQNLSPNQSKWTDLKQYQSILDMLYTSIKDKDDTQIRSMNMYPYYFDHSYGLTEIGYTFLDLNHDGVDELITGVKNHIHQTTQFYDIFTLSCNKPVHVLSGSHERESAKIGKNGDLYYGYKNPMGNLEPYNMRIIVNPTV